MDDESDKSTSRICHMCWMNKPLIEFVNRAQTRYCKICKTCRSGQLLRYYEKKKSAPMIRSLRKELSDSQTTQGETSEPPSPIPSPPLVSAKTEMLPSPSVSLKQENTKEPSSTPVIPFLQSRCRKVDSSRVPCDFIAKLIYHETYNGCSADSLKTK